MKKLFTLLCVLGVVLPYYNIYKFIEANNWEWSTALFFEQINLNYGMKILNADLTVAATTFLIFILYKLKVEYISLNQFLKYVVSLFIVGFSLALPLYLFDYYNRDSPNAQRNEAHQETSFISITSRLGSKLLA